LKSVFVSDIDMSHVSVTFILPSWLIFASKLSYLGINFLHCFWCFLILWIVLGILVLLLFFWFSLFCSFVPPFFSVLFYYKCWKIAMGFGNFFEKGTFCNSANIHCHYLTLPFSNYKHFLFYHFFCFSHIWIICVMWEIFHLRVLIQLFEYLIICH